MQAVTRAPLNKALDAMHRLFLDIYNGSGLASFDSPWLAALTLNGAVALCMSIFGGGLRFSVVHTRRESSARLIAWVFWASLFGTAAFFSVALKGFIIGSHIELESSVLFNAYYLGLFAASGACFVVVATYSRTKKDDN